MKTLKSIIRHILGIKTATPKGKHTDLRTPSSKTIATVRKELKHIPMDGRVYSRERF